MKQIQHQSDLQTLCNAVEEYKKIVDQLQRNNNNLETELNHIKQEYITYKKLNEQNKLTIFELEETISQLMNDLDDAVNRLNVLETEKISWDERVEHLREEILIEEGMESEKKEKECNQLKRQMNKLMSEVNNLKGTIHENDLIIQYQNETINDLEIEKRLIMKRNEFNLTKEDSPILSDEKESKEGLLSEGDFMLVSDPKSSRHDISHKLDSPEDKKHTLDEIRSMDRLNNVNVESFRRIISSSGESSPCNEEDNEISPIRYTKPVQMTSLQGDDDMVVTVRRANITRLPINRSNSANFSSRRSFFSKKPSNPSEDTIKPIDKSTHFLKIGSEESTTITTTTSSKDHTLLTTITIPSSIRSQSSDHGYHSKSDALMKYDELFLPTPPETSSTHYTSEHENELPPAVTFKSRSKPGLSHDYSSLINFRPPPAPLRQYNSREYKDLSTISSRDRIDKYQLPKTDSSASQSKKPDEIFFNSSMKIDAELKKEDYSVR